MKRSLDAVPLRLAHRERLAKPRESPHRQECRNALSLPHKHSCQLKASIRPMNHRFRLPRAISSLYVLSHSPLGGRLSLLLCLVYVCHAGANAQAQPPAAALSVGEQASTVPVSAATESEVTAPEVTAPVSVIPAARELRFSFEATPWRLVLNWLADEAGMALQMGEAPSGSFTYSDPNPYTPLEAINRINLFLIPNGFSVVKSRNLLSVIRLSDSRSQQQLDALAETVTVEELASRGSQDVVRCLFPLGDINPETAAKELAGLTLMREPIVLAGSNQLLITETAGKLQTVAAILSALKLPRQDMDIVKSFQLEHVDLEGLLAIARPHLGLEFDQTTGADINISTDDSGKVLFVTGIEEQVALLGKLIEIVDKPNPAANQTASQMLLRSHRVGGENLDMVYDVLQTLLSTESLRLSKEPATNSVVAFASPEIHEQIVATITELAGARPEFAIIDLQSLDPYFVITLLSEMLDIPTDIGELESTGQKPPKIDADPANRRLFVRGTAEQISEIQQVVQQLEKGSESGAGSITIPVFGSRASQMLETAEEFWRGENPIVLVPAQMCPQAKISERVVNEDGLSSNQSATQPRFTAQDAATQDSLEAGLSEAAPTANFVSTAAAERGSAGKAPIRSQVTPQGIVIESDDPEALQRFEEHLKSIGGVDASTQMQAVVFYLKYSTADDATRLLADLLDGTVSLADAAANSSLVNGLVPSATSSFLGSYLRSGDGAMVVSAGTTTVISDARLNRLICLGSAADIELIEQYLRVIDKDESITDVATRGISKVIDLEFTKAEEVAAAIRDAYVGRIALTTKQQQAQQADAKSQRGGGNDADQKEKQNNLQTSRSKEPEMTVAVHESSNSLIVRAPKQLLAEVEELIRELDQRGATAVEVLSLSEAGYVRTVLQDMFGDGGGRSGRSSRGSDRSSGRNDDRSRN
jgi:type II secretory pathway component GspD/PulD (secretin)